LLTTQQQQQQIQADKMDTNDGEGERPQFARTPGRDIFGNLDDHLPEVRINSDVRADAAKAAAKQGLDLSARIRELVYGSLYGPGHVATLHANRIRRVLGNAGHPVDEFIELRVLSDKKGQGATAHERPDPSRELRRPDGRDGA
jgi:hypothetical protein